MDFTYSEKSLAMAEKLNAFMAEHIIPANREYLRVHDRGEFPLELIQGLKAKAKAAGLWNLFLPSLPEDQPGTRLSNSDYAPLAEIMGRFYWCSEVFNCNPPDTGNMELLHLFGTEEQKQQWFYPLLNGDIRSVFSMTEPDVASSDATNICTTITREGDEYVISGRKWYSSAASHPLAKFTIVMGVTDSSEETPVHRRQSMVIVPLNTPGVRIVRDYTILNHRMTDGICEVVFDQVRVPASNLLGEEGAGFALAQARLGPGRVHHCMRAIGMAELALELMCDRVVQRTAFGKKLADFANNQDLIARSRMEIDQARLLTLQCASKIDNEGNRAATVDVSAIKYVTAIMLQNVADRAMQVYGGAGLTPDTPLAFLFTWGRAMRFLDGPDEVHLRNVARQELKYAKANPGFTEKYMTPYLEE
ncbi:acyl-CoA dehydrogenase family protein [Halioxenophilus sp. WMMB6]|uniref:acyl-CoA dehydrogenase family protein n=1 Tax=Halioxenophilus sp. WMMB6 TaxID=3073815 RepID=UPI00295F3BBB|nr:acyl-CoA dehydrogenase family protein [Halioxenophilus sp. WMMB6]